MTTTASLPLINEDEARRRAYAAFMKVLGVSNEQRKAAIFKSHGLLIRGKNELLYRSSAHDGELVELTIRTKS